MTDPMLRKLARQLVSVDKRVRDLETVPQLAHSSIDDSALPVYDAEGTLVAKVGKQDDGTWGAPPLSGPTPPAPRGVTATGGPGTINVVWTGEFARDAAPLDFDTLEVLVDGTLAGAIPNRDGGTVSISAEQGTRFVSARIRTLVPRHSSTISPFGVEVGPPADQLFAEARERIEDAEMSLGETQVRLEGAEQAVTEVRDGLDTLETVTLPSAVADLEAADAAAQTELTNLDGKLTTAQGDLADAKDNITQLGTDLAAESDAREQLASDVQTSFTTLDGKLETLDGEVDAKPDFDDLTVGNLLAGSVATPEAVIERLWVDGIVGKAAAFNQIAVASGNILVDPQGLDPALRSNVGGARWVWDDEGKYWTRPAVQGGTTQFNAYTNVGLVYDSNLLDPGAMYVISYEVWVDTVAADTAARASIYYKRRDGTTSFVGDAIEEGGDSEHWQTPIIAGQWNKITRHWRAPDDVLSGGFNFQLIRGGSDSTEVRIRNPFVGKQAASVMIEDGAVNAQKVNAESVAGAVGQFLEIEAGQLVAGDAAIDEAVINRIWTDGIAAKSITSSRLVIASGNLVPNGDGERGSNGAWPDFDYVAGAPPETGARGGFRPKSLSDAWRRVGYDEPIPVTPGDQFFTEIWIDCKDAGADTAIAYDWLDASGGYLSRNYAIWPKGMAAGLNHHTADLVAPAGAAGLRFQFVTNHSGSTAKTEQTIYGFTVKSKAGAVLIEDGAITTPKLTVTEDMSAAIVNAMSVSTKKLVVSEEAILNHATLIGQTVVDDINVQGKLIGTDGVFTGTVDFANVNVTGTQIVNKLGANSIEASMIKGGSFSGETFTGGSFAGGTFDGATFRGGRLQLPREGAPTGASPHLWGGIQIHPKWGIEVYDNSNGTDRATRIFHADPDNGGLSISANLRALNSSNQGVVLVPQTGTHGNAALIFTDDGGLGAETAAIWRATYSGAREPLNLRGAHQGGVRVHGNLLIGGNIDGADYITAKGLVSPQLYYYGSGGVTITGEDSVIYARNDSSGPQFAASAIPGRSAGGGANVYCTGFGTLARTSSSRRYKKEIEDWEPSVEKVLALQPRSWVPVNNEDDGSDATAHGRYVGFVAEEVQDVGLEDLVTYSLDENNDRQAEGLHYDRFAAAQQVVLVDHESRIKELEARIAELEGAGQ